MRRLLPLLLPLLLAGCFGESAPRPSAPLARLRAGFLPHGLADTIVVDAVDRLPLRAAELVGPDARVTPANGIDVVASPEYATGQWTVSNAWQAAISDDTAIPGSALGQAQAGAALRSREQILATVSRADIPLPDPVEYRRDWQNYRIRLTFGTPPSPLETREIAAPAPPPGS